MAKTKISEYSSTASSNTDIDSINIDEGCAPSNLNDAIRELMAHVKDFQSGVSGDSFSSANATITGGSISGISDLAVADGGTGASDAATARTNLGVSDLGTQSSSNVSITGGSISGITDLAVADGGTGASNAASARSNLGIGSVGTLNYPGGTGSFLRSDGNFVGLSTGGVGQGMAWYSGGRSTGTWYYNSNAYPIMVAISLCVHGTAYVGPSTGSYTTVFSFGSSAGCGPYEGAYFSFIVPSGYYYYVTVRNLHVWSELR